MHSTHFVQDLTVVMLVAGFITLLFRRLKQPVVLGYILAGIIVGPYTPPFTLIHDEEIIKTLANLGVILLMFSLGLHFNIKKLKKIGLPAFIAAFLEIVFMVWIGYELGMYFWNDALSALFLGGILAISSTTIIVKALQEMNLLQEKFSELVFGILIVEDILAMALIALLSGIAQTGALHVGDVFLTLFKLGIFLSSLMVAGLLVVPPLMRYIAKYNNNEMTLIVLLALCFGISYLAVSLGYSEALGAFMIGSIVAGTRRIGNYENIIAPVKDMFSAIFFVSIGMFINPFALKDYWHIILLLSFVVIVGKIFTCTLGSIIAGIDLKTSMKTGMSLAQIGEFSFIIATLGLTLKVTNSALFPIAVMVSAITTLTTPYLIRVSDPLTNLFVRTAPPRIVGTLDLYSSWLTRVFNQPSKNVYLLELKSALLQVFLNLLLITAIFIIANFGAENFGMIWKNRPSYFQDLNPLFWSIGFLTSLPLMISSSMRLKGLAAQLSLGVFSAQNVEAGKLDLVRAVFANTFTLAGVMAMGLWILFLSSTMFTQLSVIVALGMLILVVGAIFWKAFDEVYLRAQRTLKKRMKDFDQTNAGTRINIKPPKK